MRLGTRARQASSKEIKEKMAGKGEGGESGKGPSMRVECGVYPPARRYFSTVFSWIRWFKSFTAALLGRRGRRERRHLAWNPQDYFLSVYSGPSRGWVARLFISSFPREWVKLETSLLIFFLLPPPVRRQARRRKGVVSRTLLTTHRPRISRRAWWIRRFKANAKRSLAERF